MDDYSYLLPKDTTNYQLLCILATLLIAVIICIVAVLRYAKTGKAKDMVDWRKKIGWPLCEIFSIAAAVISGYIFSELSTFHPFYCWFPFCLICAISFLSSCFCYTYFESLSDEERRKLQTKELATARAKSKEIFDAKLAELAAKYGECTINENLSLLCEFSISTRFLVFEQSNIIIIKGKEYGFLDIIGCSLVDDATNETITTSTGTAKTSTGSMLGRAVVGGVLIGGLGAVAGAATAKKNIYGDSISQTTTTHKYTLYINVNNLQEPTISLKIGDNTSKAQKLAGVLNVIVERGKQVKNEAK